MRRAPPNLDGDVRPGPPQRRDMPSCLERVHLAGAKVLWSHPSDGGLGVRKDRDPLWGCLSSRRRFQCPCESLTLRTVGLLIVTYHVSLYLGFAVLAHHRVTGGSAVQS